VEPGQLAQFRRHQVPRRRTRVRDAGGVDEHRAAPRRRPATHLNGLASRRQQGGPRLFQRQGVVRHGCGSSRGGGPPADCPEPPREVARTFSIVAFDPERKEWGVAVASKYLAVGSVVPFARAEVGAVATQSAVNVALGPKGLDLMADGKSAEDALKALVESD